ncbi:hypothetical protein R3W88_026811 [Solanum pinnatisectum]|uniref:Uncharacterized protein n=1 Tax=Solanum pinnatisectum TaxID=50273 RepID=A0AAV9LI23_9SOLN|nr:hypothetical protein R3W88_026811 [Solanum pinnatisectum]
MHFCDRDMAHPLTEVKGDQQNMNAKVLLLEGIDTNNGKLSKSWSEFIISFCSGYVTLRHESNFIMEVYSPKLFSWKLSFYQDIPRDLMEQSYDVIIPICLLEGDPLMTREYGNWCPSHKMNSSQGNLHLILKKSKHDHKSMSSKGASNQPTENSHPFPSLKRNQMRLHKSPRPYPSPKPQKKGTCLKSKVRHLTLVSKVTSTASKVGQGSFSTNETHISSDNDDVSCGINILDTIGIDDNDCLDLLELYNNGLGNDVIVDFTTGLNGLVVAATGFHSSLNDVILSLEVAPPRKSPSNSSDDKKLSQPNGINVTEVVMNQITCTKSFRPFSLQLRLGAPTFQPQETIICVKSTFVSEMWGAFCGWLTQFSLGSFDVFEDLESSIASNLEEIRKMDIIDISALDDLVEDFFKSYVEYDALRSSKMTKESHEKSISNAQQRLDSAKMDYGKLDGSMGKLQATLADKMKIITLLNKYQENVTIIEGEIYTIEANHTLSNDEVARISKLEGAVEKSLQEIISFKLFFVVRFLFFS